jgi:hypothetical protein
MLPPFCSRMSQRSSGLPSQMARRFLLVVAEGVERQTVQGWIADDPTKDRKTPAPTKRSSVWPRGGLHLVRPTTGQVLGQSDE